MQNWLGSGGGLGIQNYRYFILSPVCCRSAVRAGEVLGVPEVLQKARGGGPQTEDLACQVQATRGLPHRCKYSSTKLKTNIHISLVFGPMMAG